LAAEGSATLGGNLSTNAGGTQVLRYGNARDLTLGLEVVLPSGSVWNGLRALRKDNAGYDLKHLFIGAEGTLGVITAATLKIFPEPVSEVTALAAVDSLEVAVALLQSARAAFGAGLTAFEVMSASCLTCVAAAFPDMRQPFAAAPAWCVLVERTGQDTQSAAAEAFAAWLDRAIAAGHARDAVLAQSIAEGAALWALREAVPEAQARSGGNIKHDISLPVSALPAFVSRCNAVLQSRYPWIHPVVFGHLGDGNLHYNLASRDVAASGPLAPHEDDTHRLVYDLVQSMGGSFSAEHGIGQLKRGELIRYRTDTEVDLMRTIKRAIDPAGLMNPGKIL
jgi:FAD/FMN-containing dehydrogenase